MVSVIDGINFNRDKDGALNSLQQLISDHDLSMPLIRGVERQLMGYSREAERDSKLAQDIVMALAICALLARYVPDEFKDSSKQSTGTVHRSRKRRTTANAKR